LVEGGVIARETYVWRTGMPDWTPADRVAELQSSFQAAAPFAGPPPPPSPSANARSAPPVRQYGSDLANAYSHTPLYGTLRSDKSRTAAGILNMLIPGVGRMYLGYAAYGTLQLALTIFTCGTLWLWSFIDGIIILSGGVRLDGYGRTLAD
jgi:TM2 domain-containing membrane protein YozV